MLIFWYNDILGYDWLGEKKPQNDINDSFLKIKETSL